MMQSKAYSKIDANVEDPTEDAVDAAGFTGQMNRVKRKLRPISEGELVALFLRENSLHEMSRMIREIDKERNGFVTKTELDDIVKVLFEEELADRDLSALIRPYQSIQNKILVDYKRLIDDIVRKQKFVDSNFSVKEKSGQNGQNITPRRRTTPRGSRSTTPNRRDDASPTYVASPLSPKYGGTRSAKKQAEPLSPAEAKGRQPSKPLNTTSHGGAGRADRQDGGAAEDGAGGYVYLAELIKKMDGRNSSTLVRPSAAPPRGSFGQRSRSNVACPPQGGFG